MAKGKQQTYSVTFRVAVDTDIEMTANSPMDAIEKANAMGVTDVISLIGSHNDSSIAVTGVYMVNLPGL